MFVSLSHIRSREGLYTVPLAIELPPAAVKFERKGDKRSMQLEVLGVLKATTDKMLSRLGGNFDVNLTRAITSRSSTTTSSIGRTCSWRRANTRSI